MKEKLRNLLSVSWFNFSLIFGFFWLGLMTTTWGWFGLLWFAWFILWVLFAEKE